ncbi:Six-hairpin glycosidase [Glarea lozoyensis ATCC 20868]|uniref:Six-hairpin glycosidase n=1 Tax=Glarea lozoyensis (strain ATCC 20868 / MF5171) TaxID=1116229 RepID=S3DEX8_GLAL2|nr:Six-hairpin glycosidase [Glarea lozoyensis ATCC 20868]EPE36967.1 Six-hairpin glycosidase [Glarea lozoyensis ATCC 20868]
MATGISQALKEGLTNNSTASVETQDVPKKEKLVLRNRAGESRSPYVQGHKNNPVAWQLWGEEAVELARRENRLLFLSVGYSACHWCHVMERESFENDEVAAILNEEFIPIKIDREERPDIDRIYMNFVQATTGSGGWPLNVFVTPDLQPVFGGTYWPGPSNSLTTSFEDQVNFLGILDKLSTVWKEQEDRCRQDSSQILQQLKDFAQEGTFGDRLGEGGDTLDIELLEEAYQHFISTYDSQNGGFGSAPKFPTPVKLSFLLRLGQYPQVVLDVVGDAECRNAESMAITTLRKMARGGIHDHVGHGFSRYSVTTDWSLPHFEKMLYDNAQLLHIYLDAFLLSRDPELLGVVYDIGTYLTKTLARPEGGFYSSEDADSYYKKGDSEKREGAFYVWTKREFENILGKEAEPILSAFFNVSSHGNVSAENDAHDEFINQNVLAIASTPSTLASTFGMKEDEVVKIIKDGKAALLAHREKERVRPGLDDKVIVSWNGIAIGALARTAAVIKGFDPEKSEEYIASALKAATFIKEKLYDEEARILYRIWREGRGDTQGFADDYAFLIEGLIDLYESTFDESWLHWADDLQQTQLTHFYDTTGTGGFFSTSASAPHLILRLKDGMDSSEPSTNGTSASNLFRLSSLLNDDSYASKAKETIRSFESEMLQYPWLFSSFMPALVAGQLGVKGVVVGGAGEVGAERIRSFERMPRGGVMTFARVSGEGGWLRERNELLRSFGTDGRGRVLVCEEGVCREEGVVEVETEGGKAGDVSGVVPSVEEGGVSVKEEDSVVAGSTDTTVKS